MISYIEQLVLRRALADKVFRRLFMNGSIIQGSAILWQIDMNRTTAGNDP